MQESSMPYGSSELSFIGLQLRFCHYRFENDSLQKFQDPLQREREREREREAKAKVIVMRLLIFVFMQHTKYTCESHTLFWQ